MTEIVFIRLFYAIGLGVLLAGLGYVFLPIGGVVGRIVQKRFTLLLITITMLVALYWWIMAALRHWALRTAGVDLGYFANILWTTLHGNILGAAISGGSSFGWHFSPSLLLLSIPYALWQDPLWLMGLQALFTASGAIALAMVVVRLGMSRPAALLVSMLWLFSPILRGAMFYDFHEICMVAGFAAWITWFAISDRIGWAMLLALVAMGFKEDAPIYIGCLGIILAGSFKKVGAGWGIIALSVIYFLTVQLLLWDWLAPNHRDYFAVRFLQIRSDGEGTLGAIISDPILLATNLWNWDRLWGILMLCLPVLFLPFRRWGGLGLLPSLWLILSMTVFSPYIFSLHYAAPLVALIIISAIPGMQLLVRDSAYWRRLAGYLALGFTISLTLAQPPLTLSSQFNPAAWRPHPRLGDLKEMAIRTNAAKSLTVNRFMAPHFTNHSVFKEFPSNLLTSRFYLSNNDMGCPIMLLLMEDLGYKKIREDPIFWYLAREGEVDARQQFMERLHWMEAESCDVQMWELLPDKAASLGTALYLPADCSWNERIVISPGLMLPPGEYDYQIRMRTDTRPELSSMIVAQVNFIDYEGNDEEIQGSIIPIGSTFTGTAYRDAKISFKLSEWGRVYLQLNFGATMACWLDGIGLDGVAADFDEYYHAVFPQSLELSAVCTQPQLLVQKNDGLTRDGLIIDQVFANQVVARWQMNPGLSGKFIIIALVEVEDDLPQTLSWATIRAGWQAVGGYKQQDLCKLNIVDQHGWMKLPHLEYSRLDIPPAAALEVVATQGLTHQLVLRKLWLTPAPMWNY